MCHTWTPLLGTNLQVRNQRNLGEWYIYIDPYGLILIRQCHDKQDMSRLPTTSCLDGQGMDDPCLFGGSGIQILKSIGSVFELLVWAWNTVIGVADWMNSLNGYEQTESASGTGMLHFKQVYTNQQFDSFFFACWFLCKKHVKTSQHEIFKLMPVVCQHVSWNNSYQLTWCHADAIYRIWSKSLKYLKLMWLDNSMLDVIPPMLE